MRSTKYIIVQDGDGWRGYLEGYPEQEVHGNSFEALQFNLWQLHQDVLVQDSDQDHYQEQYQQSEHSHSRGLEHDRHHSHTSTLSHHTPTRSRPMSRAQLKRKARVEQLLFAVISNR